jgi:hypothetical protein
MKEIKWEDGAVCFANGKQWFAHTGTYLTNSNTLNVNTTARDINSFVSLDDFKLNEIRIGDYIEKSELDTEEKYNDAVEVLRLFGHKDNPYSGYDGLISKYDRVVIYGSSHCNDIYNRNCKRKLTYNQLMAISKLKRMMIERESVKQPEPIDNVRKPSHYQLIDGVESIEIIARSMTHEQWKGFCLGNMLKYRIRAGKKDALQQDIDKANYYGELYELHKDKCYESNN